MLRARASSRDQDRAARLRWGVLSPHRGDQRLDAHDVQHAREIKASTCNAISVATFGRRFIRKCVAPMRAFIVPNGCSTVSRLCNAVLKLRATPCDFPAREVPVTRVDRLEFTTVDGNARAVEQTHLSTQHDKLQSLVSVVTCR